MSLLYGILHTALGIFMILKGFKLLKSKAKNEDEIKKEALWQNKWGIFFKIGGIILLLGGILEIIDKI